MMMLMEFHHDRRADLRPSKFEFVDLRESAAESWTPVYSGAIAERIHLDYSLSSREKLAENFRPHSGSPALACSLVKNDVLSV